jgi:hypothetical protein
MDGFMARTHTVALFGEAEKGRFQTPHFIQELSHLVDALGNPPSESQGIFFAVQTLLYQRTLIFFRVEEEGFSFSDYFHGLHYLQHQADIEALHALCLPGVGEPKVLEASQIVCEAHKCFLITTQKDLYDYLTSVI